MGLLDAFRKDEVVGAKVLVCGLEPQTEDWLRSDTLVYKRYYPATTSTTYPGIPQLVDALLQKFDIIHVLCDVGANGMMVDAKGNRMMGTDFVQKCCDANVKLLWIASNNAADAYRAGFNARGQKINLVMIIDRRGPFFAPFLTNLYSRMSSGEAMPKAWNELCPQVPSSVHPDAPDAIFFAGRGGVRLR